MPRIRRKSYKASSSGRGSVPGKHRRGRAQSAEAGQPEAAAAEPFTEPVQIRDDISHDVTPIEAPAPDLRAAAEWASVITDDVTLGGFLTAHNGVAGVPTEASTAVEGFFELSLSRVLGQEVPPLGELIEALLSTAKDPELLIARECTRVRPTLEALGKERGVTRERIRQKVRDDARLVHGLLESDRFRAVRWAAKRLEAEFGLVIIAEGNVVKPWVERLGERRFEMLRWVAGYLYDSEWLVRGRSARSDVEKVLNDAIGDGWLVRVDELFNAFANHVHPEAACIFLLESGKWRDIGDDWLVRWDGPLQVKAERVLRLVGEPMTPAELVEAIGHGSEGSIKNQRGTTLVRIDKQFRLALPEWGYEEYEGITTEIDQRIERGGGVASISAIMTEFVNDFGVSESSVRMYLESGPYIVLGDEVRHLVDRGYTPSSVLGRQHAVRVGDDWGQRFAVLDHHLKGYSFSLDRDIAAHNGLQPDDSLRVPAVYNDAVVGEASLIWRLTNLQGTVDVGRLSSVLTELNIEAGDEIVIVPTRESCTVLRAEAMVRESRPALSDEIKRTLLGRK